MAANPHARGLAQERWRRLRDPDSGKTFKWDMGNPDARAEYEQAQQAGWMPPMAASTGSQEGDAHGTSMTPGRAFFNAPMPGAPDMQMGTAARGGLDLLPFLGMMGGGAAGMGWGTVPTAAAGAGIGENLRQMGHMAMGDPAQTPQGALGNVALQTLLAALWQTGGVGMGNALGALRGGVGAGMMENSIAAPRWVEEQALGRPAPTPEAPAGAQKPAEIINEMGLSPGKKAPGVYGNTQASQAGEQLHQRVVDLIDRHSATMAKSGKPLRYVAADEFAPVFDEYVADNYTTIPDYEKAATARQMQARFDTEHGFTPGRAMTAQDVYQMGSKAQDSAAQVLDAAERNGVSVEQLPEGVRTKLDLDARISKRANEILRRDIPGFQAAQQRVQNAMFARYALLNTESQSTSSAPSLSGGKLQKVKSLQSRGDQFRMGSRLADPASIARMQAAMQPGIALPGFAATDALVQGLARRMSGGRQ